MYVCFKGHLHLRSKQWKDDGIYEAVAGSDFVLTRVAFRDNSLKYYINDRGSNVTEVIKKLIGKGVDLDNNRFLILQGEVKQISLMKPKICIFSIIVIVIVIVIVIDCNCN
ncbi:structural maintenance of chromosomes protein 4-like [Magnolia sinica]|uniref:structural maintenance of chromosomes protein 4-like n=1 Tax=Magnolia sinica TaxID=86752 RepID=UPI0026581206|nr:structural maintenance of chromosomes protein 4-like [Magnolia sinica]